MNRLKKLSIATVAMGSVLVAMPTYAAHDEDAYSSYSDTGYADVVSSRPIYRDVEVSSPREECWDEPVAHRDNRHWGVTAQTITGGLIGGVIGNQAVHGSKRDAATALGALAGAAIGANRAARQRDAAPEYTTYERRCRTVRSSHTEQRIDGYDVTYRYGGRLYHTRTQHDPGRRIPVNVSVTPANGFSRDSARYY